MSVHRRPRGRGLGAFSNSGASQSAHSKAPSPRLGGVASVPPSPRPQGLGVFSVSAASMSVHPRPRGRGLGAFSVRGVAKRTLKGSQPPSRGRHQRTTLPSSPRARSLFRLGGVDERAPPPSGTRAWSLFSEGRRKAHIQRLPAPVSGASPAYHPALVPKGSESFQFGGIDERTPPPSGTRAWSLVSEGRRKAHNQRLPAPVSGASPAYPPALVPKGWEPFQSGASPSAHSKAPSPRLGGVTSVPPRPRGRGLGAFSVGSIAKRAFKGSQPPSRGRQ